MVKATVQLKDGRVLDTTAADFDGLETFTKTDEKKPNVDEVYKGYSRLMGANLHEADGTVRLMLKKGA